MNEDTSTIAFDATLPGAGAKAFKAIVCGGLIVGVLDAIAASVNGLISDVGPAVVWQYVASGLLGRSSYTYGWMSIVLGLLIHFLIAFTVAALYYYAAARLPILIRRALIFGALYGIAVYFVMGHIISPLSAAARLPISFSSVLTGLLIHIFCVGLPAALVARRFLMSRAAD